jgi:hypothetical protein
MWMNFVLLLAGSATILALYIMMAFLAAISRENELPDLEDVQV